MEADFSNFVERSRILAIGLLLATNSQLVSRSGFFNFGRTSDVFNEVGKMPFKNAGLFHNSADDR